MTACRAPCSILLNDLTALGSIAAHDWSSINRSITRRVYQSKRPAVRGCNPQGQDRPFYPGNFPAGPCKNKQGKAGFWL